MNNFFNYLSLNIEDDQWGLSVLNAGCTQIDSASAYPLEKHPDEYHFKWNTGRILNEYQLIYVTKGEGIFESDSFDKAIVKSGTVIILFPGERHRYMPRLDTGWNEYWIGFKGRIMDDLVERKVFSPKQPCIYLGYNEQAFTLLNSIIEKTNNEHIGYQPQISGATLHLLGFIHSIDKEVNAQKDEKNTLIEKAKLLFRSNITNSYSPEQAANELSIGYSHFRKLFKLSTGISPGQYYIQLKIDKAKEMLRDHKIPIKEIAYELKFDSYFYFSKLFKDKTGFTPSAFRAASKVF
ncbi:AraC family transcriptional regulator [Pedobacter mucosus]|uniref:AraC family transcriptional regulator n=1 Tax=Pedobacter mucosus TaxID=2895286 RepID=UPI001EE3ED47|nr:AraC family transcriptional regulator [Pedobacter mucosus]UKT64879.1 AraC family transcriptional regulator [Pedobacter mucosus]